jgi:hypothetical protein
MACFHVSSMNFLLYIMLFLPLLFYTCFMLLSHCYVLVYNGLFVMFLLLVTRLLTQQCSKQELN